MRVFILLAMCLQGLKRLAKSIDTAGRELHNLIAEYLQATVLSIPVKLLLFLGINKSSYYKSLATQYVVEDYGVQTVRKKAILCVVVF